MDYHMDATTLKKTRMSNKNIYVTKNNLKNFVKKKKIWKINMTD